MEVKVATGGRAEVVGGRAEVVGGRAEVVGGRAEVVGGVNLKVLISEAEIQTKVKELGERISKEYKDKPLLIVGMLKGSFIFTADLMRAVTIPTRVDFIRTRSYRDGDKRGELEIDFDESINFSDYHVLVIEDIVDSGHTLKEVTKLILKKNPLSLEVITLLDKPSGREVLYTPDLSLFTVGNEFVVGYGLDMDEFGRGLPYIAAVIK